MGGVVEELNGEAEAMGGAMGGAAGGAAAEERQRGEGLEVGQLAFHVRLSIGTRNAVAAHL